jgi:hypothetical protein
VHLSWEFRAGTDDELAAMDEQLEHPEVAGEQPPSLNASGLVVEGRSTTVANNRRSLQQAFKA